MYMVYESVLKGKAMPVETRPEFHCLAEGVILSALDDPHSPNPIAIEVGRLIAAYTIELRDRLILTSPAAPPLETRFPIEAVALRLATKLAGLPVVKDGDGGSLRQ